MSEKNYPGIDYGMGQTNIDRETGIRFGVINMNALNEWAWESMESDYGDPTCPKCGGPVVDSEDVPEDVKAADPEDEREEFTPDKDKSCVECRESFWSDEVYGDEPIGRTLDDGEYKGAVDSQNDLMLVKSPYYTNAQFCSPCAPGAGHLENPCPTGPKTYCLGHDWFGDDGAPYPVYRVSDGVEVKSDEM